MSHKRENSTSPKQSSPPSRRRGSRRTQDLGLPPGCPGNLTQPVTRRHLCKWVSSLNAWHSESPASETGSMLLAPTQALSSVNEAEFAQMKSRRPSEGEETPRRPPGTERKESPAPENGSVMIIARSNHGDCLLGYGHRAARIATVLSRTVALLSPVPIWDLASTVPLPTLPPRSEWP